MEHDTLEDMYSSKFFKPGRSRKADQAILDLSEYLLRSKQDQSFKADIFSARWQQFLLIILQEMPNVSGYNLTFLWGRLTALQLWYERITLYSLVVELLPNSSECHCFLGHAYAEVRLNAQAADHYEKAVQYALNAISRLSNIDQVDSPLWLDAADYLCNLAKVQALQGDKHGALATAFRAFGFANRSKDTFKYPEIYLSIAELAYELDLKDLQQHCMGEAKRIKSEASF